MSLVDSFARLECRANLLASYTPGIHRQQAERETARAEGQATGIKGQHAQELACNLVSRSQCQESPR